MTPWLPVAVASVLGALAFFFAGYSLKTASRTLRSVSTFVSPGDATDLRALLDALAQTTQSTVAAVLDRDGLVVHQSGRASDAALALAGTLGTGIADAPGTHDAVVATTTTSGDPLRLRYVSVPAGPCGGLYVVATIGSRARAAPELEDQVLAAIPRAHLA